MLIEAVREVWAVATLCAAVGWDVNFLLVSYACDCSLVEAVRKKGCEQFSVQQWLVYHCFCVAPFCLDADRGGEEVWVVSISMCSGWLG